MPMSGCKGIEMRVQILSASATPSGGCPSSARRLTRQAPSPAEGRVKGAGAALSSLGQKESSSENSSLRQKIQNGILKGA